MRASDREIEEMLVLLGRDFAATRPAKHLGVLPSSVEEVREQTEFMEDADTATLTEKVVGDTQQYLMDTHLDTTWPECPRHSNHPLWFHDGAWHCDVDGAALATLGGLRAILPQMTPDNPDTPGPFVRRRKATE
jgi:hypothetical protein